MARSGGGQVLTRENTAELRRDLVAPQPKKVSSNNSPPYSSRDFARYATQMGFKHKLCSPEHPGANRVAERFMVVIVKM